MGSQYCKGDTAGQVKGTDDGGWLSEEPGLVLHSSRDWDMGTEVSVGDGSISIPFGLLQRGG